MTQTQEEKDAAAAAARGGDLRQQYADHSDGATALNNWIRGVRPNEATLESAPPVDASANGVAGEQGGDTPGTTPADTMTMTDFLRKRRSR